jgi:GNAT superfamily N-acetyltransferase
MAKDAEATLRLLTRDDIPAAAQLSAEAGWNQTASDWRMLTEVAPESCFAIEVRGALAATTTLVCYGRRLGWIGMVLTTPQYRGRGFARRLLREALAQADRRKIETVKLDATDQGRPLYQQMEFRFEQTVERWSRAGSGNATQMPSQPPSPAPEWHSDTEAFGADRSHLLGKLAQQNPSFSLSQSYLCIRAGRQAAYLGPAVCEDPEIAGSLIGRGLQAADSSRWSWDLFPNNADAVALARQLGFTPQRHLSRMVRGPDLQGKQESIYAIAGFELG